MLMRPRPELSAVVQSENSPMHWSYVRSVDGIIIQNAPDVLRHPTNACRGKSALWHGLPQCTANSCNCMPSHAHVSSCYAQLLRAQACSRLHAIEISEHTQSFLTKHCDQFINDFFHRIAEFYAKLDHIPLLDITLFHFCLTHTMNTTLNNMAQADTLTITCSCKHIYC